MCYFLRIGNFSCLIFVAAFHQRKYFNVENILIYYGYFALTVLL